MGIALIASFFGKELPDFQLLRYAPGELLTSPFSPSRNLQFIVEGSVVLYKMEEERSSVVLPTGHHEVSLIGEMELLDTNFEPFFVEAYTDVYTLAFPTEKYREQLLNDPVFLLHLSKVMAAKIAGAVHSSDSVPLKQRFETKLGMAGSDLLITDIEGTARQIGVSKRQLLRVLKQFCEEGVLEHEKRGVYRLVKKPETSEVKKRK